LTKAGQQGNLRRDTYRLLLQQWEVWGLVALLAPVAALVMMVLKVPVGRGF